MFSAVLGLASAGIGAFTSLSAQREQAELAREQMDLQRRALNQQDTMAQMNWGMAQDQLRREREQERYIREANDRRDRMMEEEFNIRLGSQRERARMSREERNYVLERQVRLDREAADQRAFQLERYLENRSLAAEERSYAQRLLEEQRRIARGEADDDLRRYAEERLTAQEERDFAVSQFFDARDTARLERAQDSSIRDALIQRANGLQSALDQAARSLGGVRQAPEATREDIAAEVQRREELALADVDRAVTRVASVGEADLIRRGLDASTVGNARRGEIAEQAASEYARAREEARQQALNYISGRQNILMEGWNADMQRRDRVFGEAQGVAGAGLEAMLRLPQLRSANDFRTPLDVGTANFVRQTRSANDWRAPLNVGSAIYEADRVGSNMGPTLNLPSAAAFQELNAGSRTLPATQTWGITSPQAFAQLAQTGMAETARAYGQNALMFNTNAQRAGEAAGASISQVLRSLGTLGDRWWSGAYTQQSPVIAGANAAQPSTGRMGFAAPWERE